MRRLQFAYVGMSTEYVYVLLDHYLFCIAARHRAGFYNASKGSCKRQHIHLRCAGIVVREMVAES